MLLCINSCNTEDKPARRVDLFAAYKNNVNTTQLVTTFVMPATTPAAQQCTHARPVKIVQASH